MSPLAEFVENRTGGENVRHGIFHRLTGEALYISETLRDILLCLREDAAPEDFFDLFREHAEAQETIRQLQAGHFIVPSLGEAELLRPFLRYRMLLPAMNPAVTSREPSGRTILIRLKEGHVCRLPRGEMTPPLIEERVPAAAAEMLRHAADGRTLQESCEDASRGVHARTRDVWRALDWLCAPARQLIRLAPPDADTRPLKHPVHYLIQNLVRADAFPVDAHEETRDATDFYHEQVSDADWNFDWVEPTVCHSFRYPTGAFDFRTYGERFCEAVFQTFGSDLAGAGGLDVLEVGCGTGSFARDFLGGIPRFGGELPRLSYTMLDYSPVMIERQRQSVKDAGVVVRHVEQDAHDFRIPDTRFKLIISNEMIADLAATRAGGRGEGLRQKPSDSWLHTGVYSFLERLWEHLAPGGVAILTEYGGPDEPSQPVAHLNHSEFSIDFTAVAGRAEQLGFRASLRPLSEFLNASAETMMLCGQQERYLCLNRLLERRGRHVPYAAFCRESFEEEWGDVISDLGVGGLQFAPLLEGLHVGPELSQFWALLLRKGL